MAAEEHITLSQAAKLAPGRPSSNCVWRWCREGVKAASGTRVRLGDPGCLSLFGREAKPHRLLADHLTSEYRVKTEGRGRTVDEWKLRAAGIDNHWLDCLVGSAVAASMQGAVLFGTDRKVAAKPPVRLSQLRRAKA